MVENLIPWVKVLNKFFLHFHLDKNVKKTTIFFEIKYFMRLFLPLLDCDKFIFLHKHLRNLLRIIHVYLVDRSLSNVIGIVINKKIKLVSI